MSYLDAVEDADPLDNDLSEQLIDIKEAIKFLADKAYEMLPEGITKERAKHYWYAHIVTALDDDNMYYGRSMCQMQDTIEELAEDE